jgi:hypothetical protein
MWNTISSSKLLRAIEDEKVASSDQAYIRHEIGKATVKRAIDVDPPNQPEFMKQNQKRKVLRQFYNHKVFYENNLLLKKLNDINNKKGALNKDRLERSNFAYSGKTTCFKIGNKNSLHNGWIKNQREEKVKQENNVLLVDSDDSLQTHQCKSTLPNEADHRGHLKKPIPLRKNQSERK